MKSKHKTILVLAGALVIGYIVFANFIYPMLYDNPAIRIAVMDGPKGKLYVDQSRNMLFPWTYTTLPYTATYDYDKLVKMNKQAEEGVDKNATDALKKLVGVSGSSK